MIILLFLMMITFVIICTTADEKQTDPEDQKKEESQSSDSEDDSANDSYFIDLLKSDTIPDDQKKEDQTPQKRDQIDSFSDSDDMALKVIQKFNLKDYSDFAKLKDENPSLYFKVHAEITKQQLNVIRDQQLLEMESRLNLKSVLITVENQGFNTQDFIAFCKYYQMSANEKSFDLYKKQVQKPNKEKFDQIKKQSEIQKNSKPEINPEAAKDTKNDYVKRALDISRII